MASTPVHTISRWEPTCREQIDLSGSVANELSAFIPARAKPSVVQWGMSVVIGQSRKSRRRNTVCLRCGKVECGAAEDRLGNGA